MIHLKTYNESELISHFFDLKESTGIDNFTPLINLKYIEWGVMPTDGEEYVYVCLFEDNNVIGAANLKIGGSGDYEYTDFNNWLLGLSINDSYKGLGYSKLIIQEMFEYLNENGVNNLLISTYTEEGSEKLKNNIRQESSKYPNINFKDKEQG